MVAAFFSSAEIRHRCLRFFISTSGAVAHREGGPWDLQLRAVSSGRHRQEIWWRTN